MFSVKNTITSLNALRLRAPYASMAAQRTVKTSAGPLKEAKQLQAKLQKEKKRLADYKSQHKEKVQTLKAKEKARKEKGKEAAKKQAAAEAKLIEKATKAYRDLSALNLYVKEKCTATNTLKDVNVQWSRLSQDEKAVYVDRAKKVNEENRKIWTDSPKKPLTAYGHFVKENWKDLGDFKKSSQAVSAAWRALSDSQKSSFQPDADALPAYKKAYEEWVANRVKLYKEKTGSSV